MKVFKRIAIIVLLLVIDMVTKYLLYGLDAPLINGVVSLKSTLNTGAAFSFLTGHTTLLIIATSIIFVIVVLFDIAYKSEKFFHVFSISLTMGGALGNLFDRIVFGGVRDFIFLDFFPAFPIFNFADMCLTVGAVLLAIRILFDFSKNENKAKKEIRAEKEDKIDKIEQKTNQ